MLRPASVPQLLAGVSNGGNSRPESHPNHVAATTQSFFCDNGVASYPRIRLHFRANLSNLAGDLLVASASRFVVTTA